MQIEKHGDYFCAKIKFDERAAFRRAGWIWNPTLKRWTTLSITKASEFREFATGDARVEIEAYMRGGGAIVAASMATDSDILIPAPDRLEYLGFQKAGVAYSIERDGVLIADPPGLGKTIQAIGTVNLMRRQKCGIIVCPASLKRNWQREFEKWDVHGYSVGIVKTVQVPRIGPDGEVMRKPHKTNPRLKGPKIFDTIDVWPDTEVVIINKEMFERHKIELQTTAWGFMIIDEAHVFANKTAKTSQFIWGGGRGKKRIDPIRARKRIFLTGTPITTSPKKLWVFCEALDPRGLGRNWETYVRRYCAAHSNGFGLDISGASNLDELNIKLRQSFMVRREKTEVLKDLPPKTREIVIIPDDGITKAVEAELSKVRAMLAQFEALLGITPEDDEVDRLSKLMPDTSRDGMSYEDIAGLLSSKNMQVAFDEFSAYRKALAIAKAPFVKEHVDRLLEAGEKVVLFCYHKDVATYFKQFYGNHCAFVTGATPSDRRQDEVDKFQNDPECNVFIGNIAAAGVGFTLTASHIVVFAELTWVPAELEQAEDRVWRIGQDNAVLIQHLVVDGSLDARMIEVLVERMDDISRALDSRHVRG